MVMDEVEGPRAMIKSPSGQSFVVKKGTIIGRNEGEIIEVSLQGIRIVEKYVDFVGTGDAEGSLHQDTRGRINNSMDA